MKVLRTKSNGHQALTACAPGTSLNVSQVRITSVFALWERQTLSICQHSWQQLLQSGCSPSWRPCQSGKLPPVSFTKTLRCPSCRGNQGPQISSRRPQVTQLVRGVTGFRTTCCLVPLHHCGCFPPGQEWCGVEGQGPPLWPSASAPSVQSLLACSGDSRGEHPREPTPTEPSTAKAADILPADSTPSAPAHPLLHHLKAFL